MSEEQEKTPSLRESLQNAINAQLHPDEETADAGTQAAEPSGDQDLDEGGDTREEQGSEGVTPPDEQGATEGEDAEKGIQAPENWSKEDQEAFNSIPKEAKELLLGIHKNMEAGLTKGQAEIAELRKRYNSLDTFFESFQKTYLPQQDKATVEQAVMDSLPTVMGYYIGLSKDPVNTLVKLAEIYNAKDELSDALIGYVSDEGSHELRKENETLRQKLQSLNFDVTQKQADAAKSIIEEFAQAKTDDGALKHPHFEDVRNTMHLLMSADDSMDMEAAYQKALLIDKTDDVISKKEKEIREQLEKERREKARKARRTPRKSDGKSGGPSLYAKHDEVPKKIGDHLRQELARQQEQSEA